MFSHTHLIRKSEYGFLGLSAGLSPQLFRQYSILFIIKQQSKTVQSGVVIAAKKGGKAKTSRLEIPGVMVDGALQVELIPEDPSRLPILSGIEVTRQEL